MHIAVIIPAYNAAAYLPDAMASVVAQVHPDWSMVVVDDGSTDATTDIAAGFADPRIRLIRQDNAGVSAARNRGLSAVTADAFLFLDADDWLAPDALMCLARALDSQPAVIAVSGRSARVARDRSIYPMRSPPEGDLLERLLVRNL